MRLEQSAVRDPCASGEERSLDLPAAAVESLVWFRARLGTQCTVTLADGSFSSYDIGVSDETIDGVPVTEEQIAAWASEAEAGYDVAVLRERGRGRPGRGAEPSQVVAVRLTAAELEALDARAVREHKTRSQVVREALAVVSGA